MSRRWRKNSISSFYPLLDPSRRRRLLYWWLPAVLAVSLFGLGYSFWAPEQVKDILTIHPSMRSETAPWMQQAHIVGTSPSPANGAKSKEPSKGSTKEANAGSTNESPNVYGATTSTHVDEQRFAGIPERVYVPNVADATVDVIDPETFKVVDHYAVGEIPHHVTPSWDMKKLYVNNEASSSLTVIDPKTGKPTDTVSVPYPY